MSNLKKEDKDKINKLHSLDSQLPEFSGVTSRPREFRKPPTPITAPGSRAPYAGPYSRNATRNTLDHQPPQAWTPVNRTLKSASAEKLTKRRKLSVDGTPAYASSMSSPTRSRSDATRAPPASHVTASSNEVFTVFDSDDAPPSKPKPISLCDDEPTPTGDEDPIALTPCRPSYGRPSRLAPSMASTSRTVHPPGESSSTQRLRQKHPQAKPSIEGEDPNDSIEEFPAERKLQQTPASSLQRKTTPGREAIRPNTVQARVNQLESRKSGIAHINFTDIRPKQGVVSRMQRKTLADAETAMTETTSFLPGTSRTSLQIISQNGKSTLPKKHALAVESLFHGVEDKSTSEHNARWLVWDVVKGTLGITTNPDSPEASYLYHFDLASELANMKWCEQKSYPFLQFQTRSVNRKLHLRKPPQSSGFRLGHQSRKGLWTLTFDSKSSNMNAYIPFMQELSSYCDDNSSLSLSQCIELLKETTSFKSPNSEIVDQGMHTAPIRSSAKRKSTEASVQSSDGEDVAVILAGTSQKLRSGARNILKEPEAIGQQIAATRRSARQAEMDRDHIPLVTDPEELILVYPPSGSGALNITKGDVARLQPGEFLNDTLIEFGLKLWLNDLRAQDPGLANQVHVFSSFFYKKLNVANVEEGYMSVRKWTSKVDLFQKKCIVVPINENMHWYLAIIYQPEHILEPPRPPTPPPVKVRTRQQTRPSDPAWDENNINLVPGVTDDSVSSTASGTDQSERDHREVEGMLDVVSISHNSFPSPREETQPADNLPSDNDTVKSDRSGADTTATIMDIDEEATQHQSRTRATSSPLTDLPEDMSVDNADSIFTSSPIGSPVITERIKLLPDPPIAPVEKSLSGIPVETTSFYGSSGAGRPSRTSSFSGFRDLDDSSKSPVIRRESLADIGCDNDGDDEMMSAGPAASSGRPSTFIFTLDSLGSQHTRAIKVLEKYMQFEARDKKQLGPEQVSPATGKKAAVPNQPNFCDCGVYLLHFAQTFMKEPQKFASLITSWDTKKRGQTAARDQHWGGEVVADLREGLRTRIGELSTEWKAEKERKHKLEPSLVQAIDNSAPAAVVANPEPSAPESDDEPILVGESSKPLPARKPRPLPRLRKKGKTKQEEDADIIVGDVVGPAERF